MMLSLVFFTHLLINNSMVAEAHDIQQLKSPSGIEIWLKEAHDLPVATVNFAIHVPLGIYETFPSPLHVLGTTAMLRGTKTLDERSFLQQMQRYSISFSFSPKPILGNGNLFGNLKFLTKYKSEAQKLVNSALIEPRFDQSSVERLKRSAIGNIQDSLSSPEFYTELIVNEQIFSDEHPQGHLYGVKDIEKVSTADLKSWHEALLFRDLLKVVIVGDFSAEEAIEWVDQLFLGLPSRPKEAQIPETKFPAQPNFPSEEKTTIIEFAGPQSNIAMAQNFIDITDPDYMAAYILYVDFSGGSFSSRLMEAVREEQGLVYSIYGTPNDTNWGTVFAFKADTANENAVKVIQTTKDELKKYVENGPDPEKIEKVKNYLIGSYFSRFTSTSDIASQLINIWVGGYGGPEYLDEREQKIKSVTMEQLRRVAKRIFKPENLMTVVTGQPSGVEADKVLSSEDLKKLILTGNQ